MGSLHTPGVRFDWHAKRDVPRYKMRALAAVLPFVIAMAISGASQWVRCNDALDDLYQLTVDFATADKSVDEFVAARTAGRSGDEQARFAELVRVIDCDLRRSDIAHLGDAREKADAIVRLARRGLEPELWQVIPFEAVFVLWIPILLAATIWGAGRRIVRRLGVLEADDKTTELIETPYLARDFKIVEGAGPLRMFVPRLIFGSVLTLGTAYILCPLGVKATQLMSLIEIRALPGHTSQPLWSTAFGQAPTMAVGFVGFLMYSLIAASRRYFTDDLSDRFVLQLLGRALVVTLLGFVLSSTPLDGVVSRLLVFMAGVFPLAVLEQLAERVKLKMDPSLAAAASGFDGLGVLSPLKLEVLRDVGIESTADLATTDVRVVAGLVRASPALVGHAVDRAILLDALGVDGAAQETAAALAKFGVTTATELVDLDGDVKTKMVAALGDGPAEKQRQLRDDSRIKALRKWQAAWQTASRSDPEDQEKKAMTENAKPPTAPEVLDPGRVYHKPVAWLMGPQLLASLKHIIVHEVLYKGFDIRDWMHPEQIPFDMADLCKFNKSSTEPFWFDYVADTGDGQLQTYAVAYMCLANLTLDADQKVRVLKTGESPAPGALLPRGSFLFIGGDTAYHVADRATLETRFQTPFEWALRDLAANGCSTEGAPRPLLGIPGNHDYYDMLNGFNRQFRTPVTERFAESADARPAQLQIPGFRRVQEASYFAAALPHGWWLYGIDTERDEVDYRQRVFFETIQKQHDPKRLIVATPSPTTVHDCQPERSDPLARSFAELGLKQPFVANSKAEDAMAVGECRVDISGDVHHYARYWGPSTRKEAVADPHYTSVVSGLGGAFHHPATTRLGKLLPQVRYPTPEDSRRAVASIFSPMTVLAGGYARGIGAFIAALFACALLVWDPARSVVQKLLVSMGFDFVQFKIDPWPNRSAALVFLSIVGLILTLWLAAKLAGRVYARSKDSGGTIQYLPCLLLAYAGVGGVALACGHARDQRSGEVTFDVTLYFLVVLIVVSLVLLAVKVGAGGRPLRVKLGFLGLGLWHLAMQVLPIALMIKVGSKQSYGVTIALWAMFCCLGYAVLRTFNRGWSWIMLALWIVFGTALLVTPLLFPAPVYETPGGATLIVLIVLAIAFGLVHSCIQLSWYLIVSLGFNGHNNEVGGAVRIGDYKEFIRFCVEPDKITGYVIAVDKPQKNGANMVIRLVDRFSITPKPQ